MVGLAAVLPSVITGKLLQYLEALFLSEVSPACLAQALPLPPNQETAVVSPVSSHLSDYTGGWDSHSTLEWSEGSDVDG